MTDMVRYGQGLPDTPRYAQIGQIRLDTARWGRVGKVGAGMFGANV